MIIWGIDVESVYQTSVSVVIPALSSEGDDSGDVSDMERVNKIDPCKILFLGGCMDVAMVSTNHCNITVKVTT